MKKAHARGVGSRRKNSNQQTTNNNNPPIPSPQVILRSQIERAIRLAYSHAHELERARALYICERIAFALRRKLPVFAGMNLLEAEQIIADILQREIEDIVDSTATATARDVSSDLATDLDLNIWL
jgi:hypothetical protein